MGNQYLARFTNGKDRYTFTANRHVDDDDVEFWEISFVLRTANEATSRKVGITGTGNAVQIFATIVEIIKAFVVGKKPKIIKFTADEPSRVKLYDRMTRLLKAKGYSISRESDSIGQEYTAIKKYINTYHGNNICRNRKSKNSPNGRSTGY